jgi:GTP cyclohydrolase I
MDYNSKILFGFVKNQLRAQRYETTEAIQKAVRQCLRMAGTEFYRRGIFKLPERWKKCVQRNGDYVEK